MTKDGMYSSEELAEAERQLHDAIANHEGHISQFSPFKLS